MPLDAMPPPGGVLTLDLGSGHCGWSYGPLNLKAPVFGSWRMPDFGGDPALFTALANMVDQTMTAVDPTHCIVEKSLSLQALAEISSLRTVEKQIGLRAIVASECYRHSVAFSQIDAKTVRYEILGRSHFPKKGDAKKAVVRHCHDRGIRVDNDHEGDAVLIWLWFKARTNNVPAGGLWETAGTA